MKAQNCHIFAHKVRCILITLGGFDQLLFSKNDSGFYTSHVKGFRISEDKKDACIKAFKKSDIDAYFEGNDLYLEDR